MSAALVSPRLQLRWTGGGTKEYPWLCHYELVLPLRRHDIRREVYDEDGIQIGEVSELVAAMKPPTRRGSNHVPCTTMTGERFCDEPYRDGKHAEWDSEHLGGLPVFVIAPDGMAFKLGQPQEPTP